MIIIGDVHGCYNTLRALMKKLPREPVCFVGDLIDRGPRSNEVVAFVRGEGYASCRGNHEETMSKFFNKRDMHWVHEGMGGKATLRSYGYFDLKAERGREAAIETVHADPGIQWLKALPVFLEYPDVVDDQGRHLFVSHSTAARVWHYREKLERDEVYRDTFETELMWGRPKGVEEIRGVYNVFGHTPVYNPVVRDHYANVDTGCFYGPMPKGGYGILTALRFPQMEVFTQEYCD